MRKTIMIRDIDISLVRTFLAVAETGGMTRAAQVLNLTQGAVSQQVKRLEALFGKPLFSRTSKTMKLTADGDKLVIKAHRLLALNDEVWHLMTEPAFSGEVKLGVPPDIVRYFLPGSLRLFCRDYPSVQVTLVSESTPILLDLLSHNEIDLTLTTESIRGSKNELLFSDNLVWIGTANGDACKRTPLPVALGSESCAFREPAVDALNQANVDWNPVVQVGGLEAILACLDADMAIAPYMSKIVPSNLKIIEPEVGLPALPQTHVNLRMPSSSANPIAQELANYIHRGIQVGYSLEVA